MDGARLLPFASWPSEPVHVTLNWPLAGLEVVFENLTRTGRGARSRPGPGAVSFASRAASDSSAASNTTLTPRQDTDAPGRSGRVRLVRWSRGIRRDKELHGQEEGTSARHRPHGRDRPDRVRPVRARVRRVRARVPPLPRVACPVPAVGTDRVPHPVLGRHRHRDLRRHRRVCAEPSSSPLPFSGSSGSPRASNTTAASTGATTGWEGGSPGSPGPNFRVPSR